jgi:acetyl esterase/lipase
MPKEPGEQLATTPPLDGEDRARTPRAAKLDDDMQAVLTQLESMGGRPLTELDPATARQQPAPADAVLALLRSRDKSTAPEKVAKVEDRSFKTGGETIPLRIYWPKGKGPHPVVLYIHGGGWVVANLDTYDSTARALANEAEAIVVSTHYRQAPEYKFPTAHNDVFAAYRWTLDNANKLGGRRDAIAVAGESAGANMAAAVCMMARDAGISMPIHQVLVYPVAHYGFDTPSYAEHANAKPLNKDMMAWFFDQYLNSPDEGRSPMISLADSESLKNLPPATLITADLDPLRSEGQMLALRLKSAGVDIEYRNYEGVTHEFFGMGAVVDDAEDAMEFAADRLEDAFEDAEMARRVGLK